MTVEPLPFRGRHSPDASLAAKRSEGSSWRSRIAGLWGADIDPEGRRFKLQERLIPLPLLLLVAAAVIALTARHAITPNLPTMIGVLFVGGFTCAEIGSVLPLIKRAGGPALTAAFLPSYIVSRHWLPNNIVEAITTWRLQGRVANLRKLVDSLEPAGLDGRRNRGRGETLIAACALLPFALLVLPLRDQGRPHRHRWPELSETARAGWQARRAFCAWDGELSQEPRVITPERS